MTPTPSDLPPDLVLLSAPVDGARGRVRVYRVTCGGHDVQDVTLPLARAMLPRYGVLRAALGGIRAADLAPTAPALLRAWTRVHGHNAGPCTWSIRPL